MSRFTVTFRDPFTPGREITSVDITAVSGSDRRDPERFRRAALHLFHSDRGPCRIGGVPRAAPGASWPRSKFGPLQFVADVDFADLARRAPVHARPDVPEDGVLSLFFSDPPLDAGTAELNDFRGWAVLFAPSSAAAVDLAAPPELTFAQPRWLDVRAASELPHPLDLRAPAHPERTAYQAAWPVRGEPDHKLLGHPTWIQPDARVDRVLEKHGIRCTPNGIAKALDEGRDIEAIGREALEWRLLLQIDSDRFANLMWGDVGTLYLLILPDALRRHAFEEAELVLQCC